MCGSGFYVQGRCRHRIPVQYLLKERRVTAVSHTTMGERPHPILGDGENLAIQRAEAEAEDYVELLRADQGRVALRDTAHPTRKLGMNGNRRNASDELRDVSGFQRFFCLFVPA